MRILISTIVMSLCLTNVCSAQIDQLKGMLGGTGSSAGGLSVPSVSQASPGNLAGVLQYCIKNKMLGGADASSVSSSLLNRAGGQNQDSGYQSGRSGLLGTGNGQSFSLEGGGIKQQVTQKVCDLVLQRGKSLL